MSTTLENAHEWDTSSTPMERGPTVIVQGLRTGVNGTLLPRTTPLPETHLPPSETQVLPQVIAQEGTPINEGRKTYDMNLTALRIRLIDMRNQNRIQPVYLERGVTFSTETWNQIFDLATGKEFGPYMALKSKDPETRSLVKEEFARYREEKSKPPQAERADFEYTPPHA